MDNLSLRKGKLVITFSLQLDSGNRDLPVRGTGTRLPPQTIGERSNMVISQEILRTQFWKMGSWQTPISKT